MSKLNFQNNKEEPSIEITIQIRDKDGKPTGKTKTFGSEEGSKVSSWYNNQTPSKKKRRKKRRNPSKKQDSK